MTLIAKRIADGSLLRLIKPTLQVGVYAKGQGRPTKVGVPQGSPISLLYSNISLNLLAQLWHSRGYPAKLGATLHRYADDAILVCRRSPQPVLAVFEAIAKRMDLTLNRDKTRVTRVIDGCDFLGFHFVKRQSPRSGKHTIYTFPATFPSKICSTEDSEPPEVPHVTTSPDHPEGIRGDGESKRDGVGELCPTYERSPGFSWASAFREYPFSPVRDPEK